MIMMSKKLEVEFIVDNNTEMRPVLIETANALEDGYMPSEEEIVAEFDMVFDDIS